MTLALLSSSVGVNAPSAAVGPVFVGLNVLGLQIAINDPFVSIHQNIAPTTLAVPAQPIVSSVIQWRGLLDGETASASFLEVVYGSLVVPTVYQSAFVSIVYAATLTQTSYGSDIVSVAYGARYV